MTQDVMSTELVVNAVTVFLLQLLKNSKWFPWLTTESAKLNRWIAIVAAGLASIGVNSTFDHTTGTLVITGLTLISIWHGLCQWVVSFVGQQVIFKATASTPNKETTLTKVTISTPTKEVVSTQEVTTPIK